MLSRPRYLAAAAIQLCAGVACGGPDDSSDEALFLRPSDASHATCESGGPLWLDLYSPGSDPIDAVASLNEYYRSYGLSVETHSEQHLEMPYALDDAPDVLREAVEAAYPGVDLDAETFMGSDQELVDLTEFLAAFITAPIRRFVEERRAGARRPALVFTGRVNRNEARSTLAITLSPRLLERLSASDDEEGQVWSSVTMPVDFAPVMFVGSDELQVLSMSDRRRAGLVLAHELGHAGGLTHHAALCNLMSEHIATPAGDCAFSMTDAQFADFCAGLGLADQSETAPKPRAQALHETPRLFSRSSAWQWARSRVGAL